MSSSPENAAAEPFEPPKRLFRYFSQWQSNILNEQRLWFSSPTEFNDIFEGVPRYDHIVPEAVDMFLKQLYAHEHPTGQVAWEEFRRDCEPRARQIIGECAEVAVETFQIKFGVYYRIVCFSEHIESLLMWGHYTDSHQGFALEFNPQHPLFKPPAFGKVLYSEDRPVLNFESRTPIFFRKSRDWAYEDEHRLVKKISELSSAKRFRKDMETEGHFLPLPIDAIKTVYFGARMPQKNRLDLLMTLERYPHIKVFFMRVNRTLYKLDAVPWEHWKEPSELSDIILSIPWEKIPD